MKAELPQLFSAKGRTFNVEAEHPIASRGGSSKEIFAVISGQVLLHSSSVRGREFVIDVLKASDLFGLAPLLGAGHRVDAIALTQCTIAALDVVSVERAMREQPDLALSMVRLAVRQLLRRTSQAEDFALLSFGGRLAKFLLKIADDQGARIAKGSKFKCEFSQTLMARMVGASRETVSRQMQKWEENGLLSHSGKTICLLNPAGLRRVADGFSESE
jgi:CRP/FNR family cyclic AMP-dependent transcriptional regulator